MSVSQQKPKLKWHRFLQFVILPLSIIGTAYDLISYFADLFGFDLSWTNHTLRNFLNAAGQDVFHLGVYFWPVIVILAYAMIRLILALYAWIGSFRWRKYSYRCWLALCTMGLITMGAAIFAAWEYGLNRGGIFAWTEYLNTYMHMNSNINYTPGVQTLIKVLLVLLGILSLLFTIANYVYYGRRRHLFSNADIQLPYEDEEDEDEDDTPVIPVNSRPQSVKEPEVIEVKPAVQPEEAEPEEVTEETDELDMMLKDTESALNDLSENSNEPQVIEPEPAEPEVIEVKPAVQPEEVTEEADELDMMLKDTEDALSSLSADTQPLQSESVGIEPLEPLNEETEAEPVFTRSHDFNNENEEDPLEATQILSTPETENVNETINFCPDCGKRIPDPDMRFCIYCGRKIR